LYARLKNKKDNILHRLDS